MKNMQKIPLIWFILLVLVTCMGSNCTAKKEKPVLTLQEYDHQCVVLKGVLLKLLNEMDSKRMREVALALESTRAAKCTAYDEECDLYGKAIAQVIEGTEHGPLPINNKLLIMKTMFDMEQAMIRGKEKLTSEWRKYDVNFDTPNAVQRKK